MVWREYAVEFPQSASASGGYADWISTPLQPLASQIRFDEVAQATSRTFLAVKRQVSVGLAPAGRVDAWPASLRAMIATVLSDLAAWVRRVRWLGVRTSTGLTNVPVATMTKLRGTVSSTSKSPYSR